MNVVIYARYSSHSQTEQSIEGQIRVCREFAQKNDYTIIGEYIDRALTGTTANRPQFLKMIEDSSKKLFEGVLVYQLDRFSRNRYDSAIYKNKLKKNGVRVFSAKENITDDASGILVESFLEGMAEYYSAELSQKVKRGHKINAEKHLSNGGTIPLGFKIDNNKQFQIDEETAPIIKKIFEMYANGYIMADIIKYLNSQNIKTAKGNSFDKNSIGRILENPKYKGTYIYDNIKIPNAIPRIISDEMFDKVQEIKCRNKKAPARSRAKTEYLLTTKLFCGTCKEMMTGFSGTSKTKKLHTYYSCNGKRKNICNRKNIQKDFIEDIVVNQARKILTNENIEKISNKIIKLIEKEKTNSNIKQLDKLLNDKLHEKQNLIDSLKICNSDSIRTAIFTEISKIENEEEEIKKLKLQEDTFPLDINKNQIKFFLNEMKNGNINDIKYRKLLINIFIDKVYIYDDSIIITFNIQNKIKSRKLPPIDQLESSFIGTDASPAFSLTQCIVKGLYYYSPFVFK